MAITSVIKFEGKEDDLVWKSPIEDFNASSQLIVDETHEALLVANGYAADLFGPGAHTLSVNNIPILQSIINIPTGGQTPFPCKVFFINKVHQLDFLWGTQGAITLEDPLYDIFMHVMLRGSVAFSISNSRKFLLKLAGFASRVNAGSRREVIAKPNTTSTILDSAGLVAKFRGIISSAVKDAVSKIMINGKISYFVMNANLSEVSEVVKERLAAVFDDYGISLQFFNIETIEVPDEDYAAVTKAKNRRSSRIIEGYTWQEERQMMIAEKLAANEGSAGMMGGMIGGAMGGVVIGNTLGELARNALNVSNNPSSNPPTNVAAVVTNQSPSMDIIKNLTSGIKSNLENVSVGQVKKQDIPQTMTENQGKFCSSCGTKLNEGAKFCYNCGQKVENNCPKCGTSVDSDAKFCFNCGTKL